jgi:hypothetical protein
MKNNEFSEGKVLKKFDKIGMIQTRNYFRKSCSNFIHENLLRGIVKNNVPYFTRRNFPKVKKLSGS